MVRTTADFVVVGAGIAGASIAYWLAPHGRVVVVERESQPGYHSTGRSAALFMRSYGSAQIRALTSASRALLAQPPRGFCDYPLLSPRATMMVAQPGHEAQLDSHWSIVSSASASARRLDRAHAVEVVPVLRPDQVIGAVHDPDVFDIDVHALHQGYLRGLRAAGGRLVCDATVGGIGRAGADWIVEAGGEEFRAPVLVDAAGAWADEIARMAGVRPIGIEPRRRSAFTFAPPPGVDAGGWPMAISVAELWYFKPDAGLLLGSPANADPVAPQDVQPEEIDIALGIHRIQEVTTMTIRRPARTWAGLRSFVADGDLVGGFDDAAPGFFWLAGQGGSGIKTSAAMGEACAALARGLPIPARIEDCGVTAASLSPSRLAGRG